MQTVDSASQTCSDTAGPKPVGSSVPLIISVLGAGFITGIIPAGLLPANVLNMEREFGLSHEQIGRIIGLCMVCGGSVGGIVGGWMCGRIGALRNMLLSLAGAAVSIGAIGFARDFRMVVGGLLGYFFSMGFMAACNVLATVMLPDRQRGVSLLHATNASGKLAGPVLAALFLHGAWRSSFLVVAALPILLVIPTLFAHANGDTGAGRKDSSTGRAGLAFWIAVVGFGLIAGSEIAVALWIPAYGEHIRGFTGRQSNLLLSIFLSGLVVGRLVASALSTRVSSRQAIVWCGVCSAFVAPALMARGFGASGVFFFLFGLAFSATWPSYFAHLSRVFPEHLGLMSGAALLSTQVGFAGCSYVSGRLAESSLAYPMVFGAAVMAVFIIAFFASSLSRTPKGGPA